MLRKRTALEWTILVIALVAIGAVGVGLVAYGLVSNPGPADLRVVATPISSGDATHRITITNRGGTTAEEVIVEVTLGRERQEVEFKAVAKGDSEDALLVFQGTGEPRARVKAFKEP